MRNSPTVPPLTAPDDLYVDLAPQITRQRLVIEGVPQRPIAAADITTYLSRLSPALDMVQLGEVTTHQSDLYGWAGWIHWETSGAHFYAWERLADGTPFLFFSVDIYTCKAFNPLDAVDFTAEFFEATKLTFREF